MFERGANMAEIEIFEQWQLLYGEHETAKTNYYKAFSSVNSKFIAAGTNPERAKATMEELTKLESKTKTWDDIKQRMLVFAKAHA